MLWYKQSCSESKHIGLRQQTPKDSLEYLALLGLISNIKQTIGREIDSETTLNGKPFFISMEVEIWESLNRASMDKVVGLLKKINDSRMLDGLPEITLIERNGFIQLGCPEMIEELDNFHTQRIKGKKKAISKRKGITTIFATDKNGEELNTVYRTIDNDTGEERFFLSDHEKGKHEVSKEKYEEFLEDYC